MKKKRSKTGLFVLPVVVFIISIIIFAFGSRLLTESNMTRFSQLDKGWSVCYDEISLEDVTLSELTLSGIQKGTVITTTNTLPRKPIISPNIMFVGKMSIIEVYVDDEEVYTYGREDYENGRLIPKKYHFIPVNSVEITHELKIVYTVGEDDIFTEIAPVYYGTMHDLMKEFLEVHRLPIFVGGFLSVYSWLLYSLAIYLLLTGRRDLSMFFSSAIAMLLGLYTFTYNDIFCLLSDKNHLFYVMEFMTLYLIPLSVSVLLYTTHTNIVTVWQRLLIIINSLLPATILVMHLLNIIHINHFVSPFQIVVLVEIVIMLPPLFIGLNKEHKERLSSETYTGVDADSYLLLGFIILIFFALLEIGKYNFIKFTGYTDRLFTSINYLTLGILYFIFCLFIYYFLYSIDSINSNYINKQLEGLAFTDTLTGLMNRAKCMQYFAAIEVPYAVVSLDLDNLKYVNDNYGHAEGDKMLRSFALLLDKAFPTASILGRVGGDEFLVAIENPSDNICDKCIRDLEDYMDNFNDGIEKFTLSASCGYAYSKEIPGAGFEEIFFLADSRMYEMKEKHHA